MKTTIYLTAILAVLVIPSAALPQGSLTPPPGPPAPVMHTLEQIFQTDAFISNAVYEVGFLSSMDLNVSTSIYVQVIENQSYLQWLLYIATNTTDSTSSRILNRPMRVKTGSTNAVYFKTLSGTSPTLSIISPSGDTYLNSVPMTELGTEGVYEYQIFFEPGWGIGDFTLQCRNPSAGVQFADRTVMQVVGPDYWTDDRQVAVVENELSNMGAVLSNILAATSYDLSVDLNTQIAISNLTYMVMSLTNEVAATRTIAEENRAMLNRLTNGLLP